MSQTPTLPFVFEQKLESRHRDRLAVVYVRQSTIQQVRHNQESTRLQYDLVHLAEQFDWPRERIVVIDDDLGVSAASAEGRHGFQRLLSEVALNHVGLILGVEISRLARSCKDWYHLLELCAMFGTLICDLDGLYDPSHYNDRLLLGLKGTMSEAELHILKQRLLQGSLRKAQRGELVGSVPIGYVRRPNGEVTIDPDQQVQAIVRLIFEQFDRIDSLGRLLQYLNKEQIRLPIRLRTGPDKGNLQWRRPHHGTLRNMLRNPMYAGAYVYGRSRSKKQSNGKSQRCKMDRKEWRVLLRDHYPAYISWSQYERNLTQLAANRSTSKTPGAVRNGKALVAGLLVCGRCGARMRTWYPGNGNKARYGCVLAHNTLGDPVCQTVMAQPIDDEVTRLALLALAPAAIEVSLHVAADVKQQHENTEMLWRQRLERARYEADRAQRQYEMVEPENRLVARTLEATWEEKLRTQRDLEAQHESFLHQQPSVLTPVQEEQIRRLASDLPTLWRAPTTTDLERKNILRQIIEKIVINVEGESEWVEVRMHWLGGHQTYSRFRRPVARIEQLSTWSKIRERILQLKEEGATVRQVAERLNREGFRPPNQKHFTVQAMQSWLVRYGLTKARRPRLSATMTLDHDERWLADLARELNVSYQTIYALIRRGQVPARQAGGWNGQWIVRADEVTRLKLLARKCRPRNQGTAQAASGPPPKEQRRGRAKVLQ
jgi:DNA invertase Pin-like site-specific DNA recombinase